MKKSVSQLAAELLEQGFRDFVGDGIVVEIATKMLPADDTCTLPPEQSANLAPLKPLASGAGQWEFLGVIKPLANGGFSFATESRPEHASMPPLSAPDYACPELADTKPGSAERIEALSNLYAATADELADIGRRAKQLNQSADEIDPINQASAFPMSMLDLADKLATLGLDYVESDGRVVATMAEKNSPHLVAKDDTRLILNEVGQEKKQKPKAE